MHDTITVGVPVLAILFGILLNQRAVDKLETKLDKLEARIETRFNIIEARLDRMQSDLSQFYRDLGDHGARIGALEKRVA